ncbi:M28 family metallopeptidase [Paucibacter sediminis]|uniref:M28 family metallopeptidase n=1 Tax=Paucibacter sediminis TaxID=3019553 RepID=A0AA95SYT9_9BURK|nr:M28 family metallopeptidase [Paucibacter sp. S2-9]WIT13909.1 M28 family metallopeptidase [Paucibacter sp. S2-9]
MLKIARAAAWAALPLALGLAHAHAHADSATDTKLSRILQDISAPRIEARIRSLVDFQTRHTLSETASDTRGIGAARRWIQRELQACSQATGGRLQVEMDSFIEPVGARVARPTELVNVVATLPGSSPAARDRLLVVSGHYDSRNSDVMDAEGAAPGANDDASGVAAVMEMACAMARHSFDATLVFMAVPGEEQGLLGATHWAKRARAKGLRVEAMITNDIIGSSTGDAGQRDQRQVRLFADGFDPLLRLLVQARSNSPASEAEVRANEAWREPLTQLALAGGAEDLPTQQLGRHLKAAGERYLPGFKVNLIQRRDRYLRGGDHLPFLERGYAAVRFSEPFEDFRHQHQNPRTEGGVVYGDLPEFVDFEYVANVARINAVGLATLALAPAAPQNVRLEATELTNDSTLSWAAGSEPELAGYRIVWRSTDSATWQQSKDVGLVTSHRLPGVSKDNVIFGVQALSKTGQASLASYPLPLRR